MQPQRKLFESTINFTNSQGVVVRGTIMKLTRSTVVMEVYNPYSIVQLSEMLSNLTIYRGKHIVYQGQAVVVNLVNTGLILIVSVSLLDPWSDLTRLLEEGEGISEEVSEFIEGWKSTRQLKPGYQIAVNEIRSFLIALSRWLEQVDNSYNDENIGEDSENYDKIVKQLSAAILPVLNELFLNFEMEAATISEEELEDHKAFIQMDIHSLVMRAPFIHRVYHKPLGYAGDYEMMNMIMNSSLEGPNTYAKILNLMFTKIPIAMSVVHRTQTLLDYLVKQASMAEDQKQGLGVLSVGCGPAIELQRFIREEQVSNYSHIHLLDFNQNTLQFALTKTTDAIQESGRNVHLKTIHQSVHKLLRQASNIEQSLFAEQYDIVYCSGLFDYLSDKVCSRLLRLFYRWIKPGGVVFATNMHTSNVYRYTMEHIAEWYLIYRDEERMASFVPNLGRQRLFTDSTGVNLCIEICKPKEQLNS